MKKYLAIVPFLFIISSANAKSWQTRVYNNTDVPWILDANASIQGNFYLTCDGVQYKNSRVIIQAHQVCDTSMTTSRGTNITYLQVVRADNQNQPKDSPIAVYGFFNGGIKSSGDTGCVTVNLPYRGDISMQFDCPATGGIN